MSGVDCDVVLIYLFACWGILLGGVKGGGGSAGGGGEVFVTELCMSLFMDV